MKIKYYAEFAGTFALVFFGTGAIIVDQQTNGAITHVGVAITFGLIVMAMIFAFGDSSGAHFNPAVTIGFAVAKRFKKIQILPYILSQVSGAFAATLILKFLFPENINLGNTIPSGSNMQSFILEFILSYLLMMVIINVSKDSKETGVIAGLAVGAIILLEAMFAGPICGASMNPARSISPAVVSGNINTLWIYILAPIAGTTSASLSWNLISKKST